MSKKQEQPQKRKVRQMRYGYTVWTDDGPKTYGPFEVPIADRDKKPAPKRRKSA